MTTFSLNGQSITAQTGETIWAAAQRHGTTIPHLCHQDGLTPAGNCRACVVEINGERTLAPSCCRAPTEGMVVQSQSDRALASQRLVIELLQADAAPDAQSAGSELLHWAKHLGVQGSRFAAAAPRAQPAADATHPAFEVHLDACIQCTRCIRACRDEQVNDVLGMALRGSHSQIVFDQGDAVGSSTCVACGECVAACPTGALRLPTPALRTAPLPFALSLSKGPAEPAEAQTTTAVKTLCPYCGVGCQVTAQVRDNQIIRIDGRDGPANHGRLCVKGRFGYDYGQHPDRLTVPLIRRADAPPKQALLEGNLHLPRERWSDVFREASWDEALAFAANGLKSIRDTHGPRALAGFGSAKGSNEEAYLFQKLVRTGFGSNNVDHCTRLCHASSVAALLEGIGSGAVSNPVADVAQAEFVLIIGANPASNHPVAASWIKNAVQAGMKLVVADPRATPLTRHAWKHLAFTPGSDVALLNALLHVVITEGLIDKNFIAERTEGFDALRAHVAACSPEAMAPICGIDAATLREVARAYATSKGSMILWGMGISQHVHGTDNARCLIALALATGQIGRPGTGLHPLRGQNNVQGASDAGLIPMMLPDYQRVATDAARQRFEQLWNVKLDPQPGLTVVEVMKAALAGQLHGLYVMGENPAMSDPDVNHARQAIASLKHMVVQDIFLTETALLADVVLPASAFYEKNGTFTNTDRTVQLARQAVQPPGQARQDLWIIQDLAQRIGLAWPQRSAADVYEEMRQAMPSITGITWQRLQREEAVTYPCHSESEPGEVVEFSTHFPTANGKARFVPADVSFADERTDAEYPFVLITGRQLEHWHTGSMSRRSAVLDAVEPAAVAFVNPLDLDTLGLDAGDTIRIASRRGDVTLTARADNATPRGAVFVAFCWYEAAANRLTNAALDPVAKIPEFKYCAVRVEAVKTLVTQ
jgi:formate dehydrogenase major subunit